MQIAYMPDTHFGHYSQPNLPDREDVSDAMDQILSEAELAEEVGFDGIWVPERHQRTETYWPSCISLLMALAARTKRVKIAPTVMMPTFHHPVHLAEQLAAIDNLSRGRLIFGAGVGYHEDYFKHFGVPFERRGRRFEEAMEVMNRCWTEREFSFDGEFFQFEGVRMTPKPYQQPRPPVWIGAFAPKPLQRALDWDGWVTWFTPAPEEILPTVEEMREKADKRGKKEFTFGMALEGWIGDEKELREKHAHRWVSEVNFYGERGLAPETDELSSMDEELIGTMESGFLCLGNKQKWIDKIEEYREKINPDWICIHIRTPQDGRGYHPSFNEALEVIEQFGEILDAVPTDK
tara:strand:- start:7438 stop:8484 length:1047 start_codon:yes stop_codon:yes gene_type:complete